LTVSRVEDLKVRAAQHVRAGDVLTDRLIERAPLEGLRKQAEITLAMMIHPKRLPQSKIAPAFYVDAETAITRAEKSEADARRKVETTDARIKEIERIASLPPSMRLAVAEHETATRAQLERDRAGFDAELKLAKAQLENARAARSTAEYMTSRDHQTQTYTEDNAIQTARMTEAQQRANIASLDYQIGLLGVVRAPFSGTIKRISWEGQQDHDVKVVLVIAVDDDVDIKPTDGAGSGKGKSKVSGFTRRMRPTAYRSSHR
jgi:multidrug resistance efflux pump